MNLFAESSREFSAHLMPRLPMPALRGVLYTVSPRLWPVFFALIVSLATTANAAQPAPNDPFAWPEIQTQARPGAYWWWMGSAVDTNNVTRELQRYHDGGLGLVHIIPIYGARGFEDKFIDYLSPKWMEMLGYTVAESHRLGMETDMTLGSGWCFGGPHVTSEEANASVVVKTFSVPANSKLAEKISPAGLQALMAFSSQGQCVELTDKVATDGSLEWSAPAGEWRVYAVSQKPSGQKVKRAAPGGQGHMLNLIYPPAMRHYLEWFDAAFANYKGPKPRALYHDSYEYNSDWAPDFFAQFEKRRGYRLQTELPALLDNGSSASTSLTPDHVARVKCDYRETISDAMIEGSLPQWPQWARAHGFITRNEAHGSPGNWLDLYAVADIPETEMFHLDRSKLVSKFASSAAHVSGKNLAAAETGTWLKEHFTETLGDMKYLVDDMFLSGINHIFYHGTCYSPDEAGWPGWHFYASYEMNPRNSIWRDVSALNSYVARCQSVLQSGLPDNDILLYWPIHDFWHNPAGRVPRLTVHAREWFEDQPIGQTANQLWNRGYAFDYISDRQLDAARAEKEIIHTPGGSYRVVVVPPAHLLPVATLRRLLALGRSGATIIFQNDLPSDVPGWGALEARRAEFKELTSALKFEPLAGGKLKQASLDSGRLLAGDLEAALAAAGVHRESMFDRPGLMCIRRLFDGGCWYFIANRSEQTPVKDWVPLANHAGSVVVMDPLTGRTGAGALHLSANGTEVRLDLEPGESVLLRCFSDNHAKGLKWPRWSSAGKTAALTNAWQVKFIDGGPELPRESQMPKLVSWSSLDDTNAQRFAGTALYTITFDAPDSACRYWSLDLGQVCQSARVRLNGLDLGTLITPPFRVVTGPLKPAGNRLEVEVTNVSANRIRDLDRRHVAWKSYYDINFVNLDYKPFDASNWPLTDSGLLGPVTITPVATAE
jgi:hypothetical protein